MSINISNTIVLIYIVLLVIYVFFTLHHFAKTLLFLYFHYTGQKTSNATLVKMRNSQWRRFLSQITSPGTVKFNENESDSNNELNIQRKRYSPTNFTEWFKCLIQRYHPVGNIWYAVNASSRKTMPIAASICMLATGAYHWIITIIFSCILTANSNKSMTGIGKWSIISVPSSVILLAFMLCMTLIIRSILRNQVNSITQNIAKIDDKSVSIIGAKRKDSNADAFLRNEQPNPIQTMETEPANTAEFFIRMALIILGTLTSLSMGYAISSCNTISSQMATNFIYGFGLSWAMDICVIRIGFILIISYVYSKSSNTVTDISELQVFEYWRIPPEVALDETCDLTKPQLAGSIGASGILKELRIFSQNASNLPDLGKSGISPNHTFEDIKTDQSRADGMGENQFVNKENENRLETVRDDAEGENMASVASPPKLAKNQRNALNSIEDKENMSIDGRVKKIWGFGDMFSSKQSSPIRSQRPEGRTLSPIKAAPCEVSFIAVQSNTNNININNGMSPYRKLSPLEYCSPLKQSYKHNISKKDNETKSSPKKKKTRMYAPENDSPNNMQNYKSNQNRMEDEPELKELIKTIKDNNAKKSENQLQKNPNPANNAIFVQEKLVTGDIDENPDPEPESAFKERPSAPEPEEKSEEKPEEKLQIISEPEQKVQKIQEPEKKIESRAEKSGLENNTAHGKNDSIVVIEEQPLEEVKPVNEAQPEPEVKVENSTALFEKLPPKASNPQMKQIELFGRQSTMANDQKLLVESIAEMKLSKQQASEENIKNVLCSNASIHAEKPRTKGSMKSGGVLDVSDFDANVDVSSQSEKSQDETKKKRLATIMTVEEEATGRTISDNDEKPLSQRSSAREQRTIIATQKGKLKKWLRLAESHDKPMEAQKIRELLQKLKTVKKPLKKSEMRDLEMLEALEMPYGTRNNLPLQRPISSEKYGTRTSARAKSRGKPQDPGKLNELYMVYSSMRPKRLNSIEMKKRFTTQDQSEKDPTPLEIETRKDLPPLKTKPFASNPLTTTNGTTLLHKINDQEQDFEEEEIQNNKHLVKIDRIIGQCFDKMRKSFGKTKPRMSSKNLDEINGLSGLEYTNGNGQVEHEHKLRPPRRSMSRADAHLIRLPNNNN